MKMSHLDFSKTVSYVLRHKPEHYGVMLDADGWAPLTAVAEGISRELKDTVTVEDLEKLVATKADKKRLEISGEMIRALHGHSVTLAEPAGELMTPPAELFHGTIADFVPSILRQGLLPKKRQFVHLSEVVSMAEKVGSRRTGELVILKIDAAGAHADGIVFRRTTSAVWLVEAMPTKYISIQ
jgi:putative RNA 2'-phosphotransferase